LLPYNKDLDRLQEEARQRNRKRKSRRMSKIARQVAKVYRAEKKAKLKEIESEVIDAAVPLVPSIPKNDPENVTMVPANAVIGRGRQTDLINRIPTDRRGIGLSADGRARIYNSSADLIRRFLEDARKGALNEKKQTRLIAMIDRMHQIALSDKPQNVMAFSALMDRAYGKPKPSEEALDALAKGGVQIVYVAPPELPEGNDLPALPPKADFIEAEIVEDE
jgi:hypothetical protein